MFEQILTYFFGNAYQQACLKADRMHNTNGRQYWVIKTAKGWEVVNKYDLRIINRGKTRTQRISIWDLLNHASYHTK